MRCTTKDNKGTLVTQDIIALWNFSLYLFYDSQGSFCVIFSILEYLYKWNISLSSDKKVKIRNWKIMILYESVHGTLHFRYMQINQKKFEFASKPINIKLCSRLTCQFITSRICCANYLSLWTQFLRNNRELSFYFNLFVNTFLYIFY